MKTITIRALRQRWPEAEAALAVEDEILITRDSKPVAKLVRIGPDSGQRKRWNPEAHAKWLNKVWGNRTMESSDVALAKARADRWEKESA
jgi:antitoxin (DNA-binding transcriptional repressor) of toxin-antitoxin stability system